MKTRTFLTLAVLFLLLLLMACNKGTPLPGGYAIFISSSAEVLLGEPRSAQHSWAREKQILFSFK